MSRQAEELLAELLCGLFPERAGNQMPTRADILEGLVTEQIAALRFLRDTLETNRENEDLCLHLSEMLRRLEVGWEYGVILGNREYVARPDHDPSLAKVLAL